MPLSDVLGRIGRNALRSSFHKNMIIPRPGQSYESLLQRKETLDDDNAAVNGLLVIGRMAMFLQFRDTFGSCPVWESIGIHFLSITRSAGGVHFVCLMPLPHTWTASDLLEIVQEDCTYSA